MLLNSGLITQHVQVLVHLLIKSTDWDVNRVDSISLHDAFGSRMHRLAPGMLRTHRSRHVSRSPIEWLLLIFDHFLQF